MKTFYRFLLFMSILILNTAVEAETPKKTVVRAAIDIGMGGPKLRIAEVDLQSNKVIKTIHSQRFFINFYDNRNAENNLSVEIMQTGLKALQEAVNVANTFHPDGIVAIATESLRAASNGAYFANEMEHATGIKIHIVDQIMEGKLAFQAILSKMDIPLQDLVVWDIGGGSMQFVFAAQDGSHHVECRKEGAGGFKDYIIEKIQLRNLSDVVSPNPMSCQDIIYATTYAREMSLNVNPRLKEKVTSSSIKVVGAGSIFEFSIAGKFNGRASFSIEQLTAVVKEIANKTDADFGGEGYALCEGSNSILVLGFMQGLKIKEMQIVNVNNADGALIYGPFWKEIK